MSTQPVRVGLIGCGVQGQSHLRALHSLGSAWTEVTALCDLSEARLDEASTICPGARSFGDYRDMLTAGGLDLVIVGTMPNTHEVMCIAAFEAGAHVLCEKPFMTSVESAERVLAVAERCGRQIQLGTNLRYTGRGAYLKQLIASGDLGEPVVGKAWGCHRRPPMWAPNYHRATSSGGALASTLVHGLDLALWVGGYPDPVAVSATMRTLFPGKRGALATPEIRARFDAEDLLHALVRCADGSTYVLEANWCDEVKDIHAFELVTTRGTVSSRPFQVLVDEAGEVVDRTPNIEEGGWPDSILSQDRDIIERLAQGRRLEMHDARQLLNLQKVISGCYASAMAGREVQCG